MILLDSGKIPHAEAKTQYSQINFKMLCWNPKGSLRVLSISCPGLLVPAINTTLSFTITQCQWIGFTVGKWTPVWFSNSIFCMGFSRLLTPPSQGAFASPSGLMEKRDRKDTWIYSGR